MKIANISRACLVRDPLLQICTQPIPAALRAHYGGHYCSKAPTHLPNNTGENKGEPIHAQLWSWIFFWGGGEEERGERVVDFRGDGGRISFRQFCCASTYFDEPHAESATSASRKRLRAGNASPLLGCV